MASLGVRTGDGCSLSREGVWLNTEGGRMWQIGFSEGEAKVCEAYLKKNPRLLTALHAEGLAKQAGVMLEQSPVGFGVLYGSFPEEDLILAAASRRLCEAKRCMKRGRWEEAALSLSALVGLGGGLTPSGDDFLCGVMAGGDMAVPRRPSFFGGPEGEGLFLPRQYE